MPVFRRRELVLLYRQAGHGPHQVGRWAQPTKGVADATLTGQQAVLGRLLNEFGDQFVDVQVAQAHRDGNHLGPRFADLVDHILDRHGWPQFDRHEAIAPVFHPLCKGLHAQRVDAIADGAGQHAPLCVMCFCFSVHDISSCLVLCPLVMPIPNAHAARNRPFDSAVKARSWSRQSSPYACGMRA